ncbi:uncharacterized protein LOC111793430 [Cucurbita pepo subsp. pepo]|uniref:uncharacterized protein LOC111793430 n=1 Tax=Cucurbita pepo subsp. pepo TaxID=3664 RepID=UPI000C9D67A9|nr:uncharacterized protein LOC111793430 [Cucurbita pepo subsp. pepo]
MDAKALAKSKRAHSQHHSKKSHPNQKHKPPSIGTNAAGSANKPLGKHAKDGNLLSQAVPKLPSNWDRYGEEISVEETSGEASAPVSDVILPKSKGADYRHLIAEARSQMQSSTFMDVFPSLDDVLPRELSSGGSAMLAARGEGMLSWIEDNSFVVDEKTTATPEASFLSLNLVTLAEQLTKLNVAERLFIEEDILPSELRPERKAICDQRSSAVQTYDSQEGMRNIEISSDTESYEKGNVEDGIRDVTKASSSSYFGSIHQDPTFNPSPISSNQVHYNAHPIELPISSQTNTRKYTEQPNTKFIIENANQKTPMFEATTAEAELDMLLNSFSETMDLDTPAAGSSSFDIDEVFKATPHIPIKGSNPGQKAPITAELDDALDDLLQDTSHLVPHKEKPVNNSHSGANSIAKDDFDSWLDSI